MVHGTEKCLSNASRRLESLKQALSATLTISHSATPSTTCSLRRAAPALIEKPSASAARSLGSNGSCSAGGAAGMWPQTRVPLKTSTKSAGSVRARAMLSRETAAVPSAMEPKTRKTTATRPSNTHEAPSHCTPKPAQQQRCLSCESAIPGAVQQATGRKSSGRRKSPRPRTKPALLTSGHALGSFGSAGSR
eukprot:scaffold222107_cov27-Tisochrysis_lutea.AAC.3